MGFTKNLIDNVYTKSFDACSVSVDFTNRAIIYPEESGLIVNDKTTSNFEHPENFVVFECVCRLLEKGYRAEHIELEPRWTLGHDSKGGKADILVKDADNTPLLIIECKTPGNEFNHEKKNTEEDGGQLFSYWQQENATRWLALYTSDWYSDFISHKCLVIRAEDDANIVKIAKKDKDVKIYLNARNDKERFDVWQETYSSQWLDDVVFSEESRAYQIGIPPLRKGQLKEFNPEDHIVNRFEEILRHNNVSDKENAFNRLVALFICKLVDEIKKQDADEVDFQYKQGSDTYESLQDRLQRLHQQGMEEFMKEEIFYVEADYAEKLFLQYTGRQRKAAIDELNRTIRILKFYSNNDFAFKDVHNEELFYQNGKIIVEVVQLFQPYRIVYQSKHQFLGDLFEQLLNKGFKQNEGQFFTPMPITRFIWDSLPLKEYIHKYDLPRVIDYACGAGHFLTEGVEAINAVRQNNDNSWTEKHIYGVEKDYRLARVSKISMFMNGAGGSNIIFGDGLENYPDMGISAGTFDILVANPPYSVKGFKQHLKLKNNSLAILNNISLEGDEIEMLFVERISQLVKPNGLAAVVLPAPILSDKSASGVAARECLLKHFYIHAIVSLNNQTFGATGTHTVTLFLERFNEPPRYSELVNDIVDGIFSNYDITDWDDKEVLDEYLNFQGVDYNIYRLFLKKELSNDEISANEYLKEYLDRFQWDKVKLPKKCIPEKAEQIRQDKFYSWALGIEKEKVYFFSLVYKQQTLVVTAPTENQAQKEFLGYEWSNRKGREGIQIISPGGKLYSEQDRFAAGTLASAIRSTFVEDVVALDEQTKDYAHIYDLKGMMDFHNPLFIKSISLASKKRISISSIYPLIQLGVLCEVRIGGTPARNNYSYFGGNNLWVSIAEMNGQEIVDTKEKITDEGVKHSNVKLIPKGTTLLSFKLSIGKTAIAGADLYTNEAIAALIPIEKDEEKEYFVLDKYLFHIFSSKVIDLEHVDYKAFGQSLNSAYLRNEVRIPVPPANIQRMIIAECEAVDEEYNSKRMSLEEYQKKIAAVFESLDVIAATRGGGKSVSYARIPQREPMR